MTLVAGTSAYNVVKPLINPPVVEATSKCPGREYNLAEFEKRQAEIKAAEQKRVLDELETRLDNLDSTRNIDGPRASLPDLETISQPEYAQANQTQAPLVGKFYAEGPEFPKVIYQKRFEEFEDLFEKYSSCPPKGFSKADFMSLLAAIAEKESSMGYPNEKRCENAITGYASGKSRNRDAEDQISATAETLRSALEGNHPFYPKAGNLAGRERMLYVLEVYNMGDKATGDNKRIAQDYARNVYSSYGKWRNLFTAD